MKGKKNPETFGGKWRYLFMILALVFSVGVSAQKTVVKGNILDRDNLPVIGANILEDARRRSRYRLWKCEEV